MLEPRLLACHRRTTHLTTLGTWATMTVQHVCRRCSPGLRPAPGPTKRLRPAMLQRSHLNCSRQPTNQSIWHNDNIIPASSRFVRTVPWTATARFPRSVWMWGAHNKVEWGYQNAERRARVLLVWGLVNVPVAARKLSSLQPTHLASVPSHVGGTASTPTTAGGHCRHPGYHY